MANVIKIKRGAAASLPAAPTNDGELHWTTDTFRLYVAQGGVQKLVGEPDFVKISGGAMTGALTLSGAPTQDLHAATKAYVDAARTGLNVKPACRLATAAALAAHTRSGNILTADANGALTVDGVSPALNDRILVKDEGSGTHLENGLYYLSQLGDATHPWKLTRTTDADESAEVTAGAFVFVSEGTANADMGFVLTTDDPITLNTTTLTFTQFSGAGQITAGAGLTKTGNTLNAVGTADRITVNADSIDIASTYAGQSTITTVGTIATGTWSATAIAANKGGTGQTSYAVGDLLYASGSSALSKLADVAAGSFLRSGGVGAAPAWSTLVLPNSAAAGDIPYASGANTYGNLTKGSAYQALGMNSGATAPAWMASLQSLLTTTGDIVQASGANTPARLAAVATGNALISGGVGTVSSWGKIGLTTHVSGLLPPANGGTGVANGANNTITFTGNYTLGLTLTGNTALTLPTSGTLSTTTHTHGNITADGKIGSTATLPIITTTGGALTTGSFGTGAGTFCQGNDSRLHTQNTDTGTTSETFQIGGATRPKITGNMDDRIAIYKADGTEFRDLYARALCAEPTVAGNTAVSIARGGAITIFNDANTYASQLVHGGRGNAVSYTWTLPASSGTLLHDASTVDGGTW
jgi:hypothetical protein